ncbi:Ig-like domain-containing protein [Heliomicrobium undosum]|nr:Ig-like domain-containing protein [Heliomicrobium undosum]
MKKIFPLTCMLAFLITLTTTSLGLCPAAFALEGAELPSGYRASQPAKPNGQIIVQVKKSEGWEEAAALPFDKHLREAVADLSALLPGDNRPVSLRLTKQGGGAAHLDAVLLGDAPPSSTDSANTLALKKLTGKDFDVIDIGEKGLELTFPAGRVDGIIAVSARIETPTISDVPFHFPLENTYRQITGESSFYSYRLDSATARLSVDGDISETKDRSPFMKERVVPGSGHPAGDTYAWVMNDEENLYIAMDFTPDNTMDGNKDYAKVYVKTGSAVKEFKVSVPETKWGSPGFTYTDAVGYQHKVYEFALPLSELGVSQEQADIQLAFAAYGTATPGDRMPVTAYDPDRNRFLSVYYNFGNGSKVYGEFINAQGVDGEAFEIGEMNDYGSLEDEPLTVAYGVYGIDTPCYLAVWKKYIYDGSTWRDVVFGQFLRADDGLLLGDGIILADTDAVPSGQHPSVAYDSVNKRYLIVWEDYRYPQTGDRTHNIYGQLLNADGTLNGSNFIISENGSAEQYDPFVAFDSGNVKYLVLWQDFRSMNYNDIYGQFVNPDGSLFYVNGLNDNFVIANAGVNKYDPVTVFDNRNNRFLAAWEQGAPGYRDIYGKLLTLAGASLTLSADLPISTAAGNQGNPSIAFNESEEQFLAVWSDDRNSYDTNMDVYAQRVNADGSLYPDTGDSAANVAIATSAARENGAWVSANWRENDFLVAFTNSGSNPYYLTYNVYPPPSPDFTIERVSVGSNDSETNAESRFPTISADGRYVAFSSGAGNLPGASSPFTQIYVKDKQTGEVTLISVNTQGAPANGQSAVGSISADGKFVAFESYASDLVPGDTNGTYDIFVRDLVSGTTERVSVHSNGAEGSGASTRPSISGDGRYVVFESISSNLVDNDTNYTPDRDIFIHDRVTHSTKRLSVDSYGNQVFGDCNSPYISQNGKFVVFASMAANFLPSDTDTKKDIFLIDLETGSFSMVSVSSSSVKGNDTSDHPSVSNDGRFIVFESVADNLVENDNNHERDIFLRDTVNNQTTRVSLSSAGQEGTALKPSEMAHISADGRYVVFSSYADNLVDNDTNGEYDVFLHELASGETTRLSLSGEGQEGNQESWRPFISSNGRYVVFESLAGNLVNGDTNQVFDIFTVDRGVDEGNLTLKAVTLDSYAYRIDVNQTHQTMVTAMYIDGTHGDISSNAVTVYTSSNPSVASVDATGKVTAHSQGTAVIRVEHGGKKATAFVAIGPARAYNYEINPGNVSVSEGHIDVSIVVAGTGPAKALFTLLEDGVPVAASTQAVNGSGTVNASFGQYQEDRAYLVRVLIWDSAETMKALAWPKMIPIP